MLRGSLSHPPSSSGYSPDRQGQPLLWHQSRRPCQGPGQGAPSLHGGRGGALRQYNHCPKLLSHGRDHLGSEV